MLRFPHFEVLRDNLFRNGTDVLKDSLILTQKRNILKILFYVVGKHHGFVFVFVSESNYTFHKVAMNIQLI